MTPSCWACTRPATDYCPTDDDGCGCPTCDLCDCACHAPEPPTSDSVTTGATT